MKPFLAVISPVMSGAHPDHELPKPPASGAPPRPDHTLPGQLPKPEHPIYYPLPPGAPVDPEYGVPDTHPDQGLPGAPPKPTHPIAPGGSPPRPDQGLPGAQPHPEHPIVLPPDSGGWLPIYIWGGGNVPMPTPPIVIPPDSETDDGAKIEFKAAWTPDTGWVTVGIIVPGGPTATPSRKK
jgi:hypothetical protein